MSFWHTNEKKWIQTEFTFMVKSQHQLVFDAHQTRHKSKFNAVEVNLYFSAFTWYLWLSPIINTQFFYSISFPLLRIRRSSKFYHRYFFFTLVMWWMSFMLYCCVQSSLKSFLYTHDGDVSRNKNLAYFLAWSLFPFAFSCSLVLLHSFICTLRMFIMNFWSCTFYKCLKMEHSYEFMREKVYKMNAKKDWENKKRIKTFDIFFF